MSTAETAARGAAWMIPASLLSRGLGLVATLILIRFVSPTDYGEVSAAAVVVWTVNQVTTLGVGVYAIANRSATREDMFHATLIHVSLGVLALLALWVLRKPLSPVFEPRTCTATSRASRRRRSSIAWPSCPSAWPSERSDFG